MNAGRAVRGEPEPAERHQTERCWRWASGEKFSVVTGYRRSRRQAAWPELVAQDPVCRALRPWLQALRQLNHPNIVTILAASNRTASNAS
jgi:hypothetical protein